MEPDPKSMEFARLLAKSSWTQAEAARQLHVAPATISQYVSGRTIPSETVLRLMRFMVEADADQPPGSMMDEGGGHRDRGLAEWEVQVLQELRKMDPSTRSQVIAGLLMILERIPSREVRYDQGKPGK